MARASDSEGKERILFIEDDGTAREMGLFNLRKAGWDVEGAADGDAGLARFRSARWDLVLTDVKMPGVSGLDILHHVRREQPDTPVIVMTAYGDVEMAVTAMKAGAAEFLTKPFGRDLLLLTVERALAARRAARELRELRVKASGVERPILHRSAVMGRLLALADRVAATDATALVTGESGTGKELVARRIHVRSARAGGPFVALNCAAVPRELLESELFGHERGAFTGAARARRGRFRQADGGTLFLDEIGELPLDVQSSLLRVLQERVVDSVGSDRPIPVDVRIVAATNRDLPALVRDGAFREDLFYRLNVVDLPIPPLRERLDDIEPLARHFALTVARDRPVELSGEFLAELRRRPWPGNVRELANAVERAAILCDGDTLRASDLPGAAPGVQGNTPAPTSSAELLDEWPPLPPGGLSLVDLERRVIERVLERESGNVSAAARYLRVPRHILTYRMEKYGIARPPAGGRLESGR